jgi:GT2 family glycosyltransferase
MDVSIVIVSRNEEAAIGACIESLLAQTAEFESEIILVDSASTDRTVEIAGRYPVTVVSIDPGADLSPSAGRYLGTLHATGKFIHFVDGDMAMVEGWLQKALAYFRDPGVCAVAGRLYRVYPGEGFSREHIDRYPLGEVNRLGGAGIYRREVLQRVGTFNPFVKGEEERELGYRILQAGYKILRVDVPMVYHLEKGRTQSEIDEKATHFTGIGQIFRQYGLHRITWDLLWQHRRVFNAHAAALVLLVGLIIMLGFGLIVPSVLVIFGVSLLLFLAVLVKGKQKGVLFFRFRLNVLLNIIKGFRLGIPRPEQYDARTSVLARPGERLT